MKKTAFSFTIKFLTDHTDEFINKLESIKGVEKIELIEKKNKVELVINVVFNNSEEAKKLHQKIMTLMIRSKDLISIKSTKSILSDIF